MGVFCALRFRDQTADMWQPRDGQDSYRLCGDGFFFKFCPRIQLEVMSEALLPGMYLPRQFVEATLLDGKRGTRGATILCHDSIGRHLTNTLFASLIRDGWLGTRGVSSDRIARIVRDGLTLGRAVVLARSRPQQVPANPKETLAMLGLK